MWMDAVILKANTESDGDTLTIPQEIRINHDNTSGSVIVRCPGLFKFTLTEAEWDNLHDCVMHLRAIAYDEEESE